MKKRDVEEAVASFVGKLTYFGLLVLFILAALGQLGQTTSFIAVIGAAGLAVGLALGASA